MNFIVRDQDLLWVRVIKQFGLGHVVSHSREGSLQSAQDALVLVMTPLMWSPPDSLLLQIVWQH